MIEFVYQPSDQYYQSEFRNYLDQSLIDLSKNPQNLSYFKTEKKYVKSRETEIHEMIEQGCFNSTQAFWDALLLLVD